MDTRLINEAWRSLPKEFKEEVKDYYEHPDCCSLEECVLENIFGEHNLLTSDTEGEEMLSVSRKKVQGLYDLVCEIYADGTKEWYQGYMKAMQDLFGSKCMPDEDFNVPEPNCKHFKDGKCAHPAVSHFENGKLVKGADCDVSSCEDVEYEPKSQPKFHKGDRVKVITDCWKDKVYTVLDVKESYPQFSYKLSCSPVVWFAESTLSLYEDPKPAEPKFKVGDKVKDISSPHDDGIYKVDDIKKSSDGFIYHIQGLIGKSNVKESALEPCTSQDPIPPKSGELKPQNAETQLKEEQTEPTCTDDCPSPCPSPCPSQHFDDIIKDSFDRHNRLHIAAMLAAGMLANDVRCYPVDRAFELADALIAEAEKGGTK